MQWRILKKLGVFNGEIYAIVFVLVVRSIALHDKH